MSKLLLCICGPQIVFFRYLLRGTASNVLYKGFVWMRLFVTKVEKVENVVIKRLEECCML